MPNLQKLGRPVAVKEKHRATHPGKLLAGLRCLQQYSTARVDCSSTLLLKSTYLLYQTCVSCTLTDVVHDHI